MVVELQIRNPKCLVRRFLSPWSDAPPARAPLPAGEEGLRAP